MPYEFKDLAKDVAQGTEKLKVDLAKLLLATQKVDKYQQKLTKTNIAALKIVTKYDKAIKLLRKDFIDFGKHTVKASKQMSHFADSKTIKGVSILSGRIDRLNKSMAGLSKKKVVIDISARGIKDAEGFQSVMADISKARSSGMAVGLGKGFDEIGRSARRSADDIDDLGDSFRNFHKDAEKAKKLDDLITSKWKEGAREAKDFGNGIGVSNGMMIGAGAAAVYLSKQVSEIIDRFTDARMELAKYRIETDAFGDTTIGVTKNGLERMRKELNLTRTQATEYFKILRTGTNELGRSPAEIQGVAKALRAAFGGDQLASLREYIDLLREIPTLDTDLKITASMDDETAAIFALAQSGKMETVIDFQSAGLLGGVGGKPTEETKGEVALLNAQQKTQAGIEAVSDTLQSYYPTWGTQFTAMVQGIDKAAAGIGVGIAITGAMRAFLAKTAVASNRTTSSIKVDTGIIAKRSLMGNKGIGKQLPSLPKGAGEAQFMPFQEEEGTIAKIVKSFKGAGAKATQAAGETAKWAKGLSSATKITTGVGAVMLVAGIAADKLADYFEESGDKLSSTTVKLGGEMTKFAGTIVTATAIGAMFGGIGAPVGALVGTVLALMTQLDGLGIAFEDYGKQLQKTVMIAGKEVPRFNATVRSMGQVLQGFGINLQDNAASLKKFGKSAWEVAKTTLLYGTSIGQAILAFRALASVMESDEYKVALAEATASAKALSGEQENLKKSSEVFAEGINKNRKALVESGLELQKQLQETENAFKSGKFALADFEAGIAKIRLGNISEMGGSMKGFSSAIKASTNAISDRFKFAGKALDEMRDGIRKNSKLEGEQRRQALDHLYKKELESVQQLVDGIQEVIDALYKSPKIIQEGLKRETAKTRLTAGVEAGAAPAKEILKVTGEMYDSAVDNLKDVRKVTTDATIAVYEGAEKVKEIQKKAGKDMVGLFGDMSEEEKKAFSVKGIVKETKDGFTINEEKATEFHDTVSKQLSDVTGQLDDMKKALPSDSFLGLATKMAKAEEGIKTYGTAVEKAEEEKAKAARKGKSLAPAEDELKAAKTGQDEAKKAQDEVSRQVEKYAQGIYEGNIWPEISKTVKQSGMDVESFKTAMLALGKATSEGREVEASDLEGQLKDVQKILPILKAIEKSELHSNVHFDKMQKLLKKSSKLVDLKDVSGRYITAQDLQTTNLKVISDGEKKSLELQREIGDIIAHFTDVLSSGEVAALEQQIETLNLSADIAAKTGSPIAQVVKSIEKQSDLFDMQYKVMSDSVGKLKIKNKEAEDGLASAEKELALAEEAAKAGGKVEKIKLEGAKAAVEEAKNTVGKTRIGLKSAENKMADIVRTFPKLGESFDKALDSLRDSFEGQKITAKLDLGRALSEFAEFSDDAAKYSAEATAITIAGAKEEASAKKKAIMDSLAAEEKAQMERLAMSKASPAEKAKLAADIKMGTAAKARTRFAEIETDQKRIVSNAARAEADMKTGLIDASQSALEAEMEVASMRGHHLSDLMNKQKEILALEADRVDAMREEYKITLANNGNTRETQIKGLQLRTAEANLQRKGLGYQKDIMDKMLGAALGEISTSKGARRQRGTDVGVMGVGATRVKTASGLLTGAGPGGVIPYQKRLNEYKAAMANQKVLKKGGKIAEKGNVELGDIRDGIQGIDTRSKSGASLDTHDSTTEGLLASILYVAKEMAVGILDGKEATNKTGKNTRDSIEKGLKDVQSEYKKGVQTAELGESARANEQVAVEKKIEQAVYEESPGERGRKEGKLGDAYMKKEGFGGGAGGKKSFKGGHKFMEKMAYDSAKGTYDTPGPKSFSGFGGMGLAKKNATGGYGSVGPKNLENTKNIKRIEDTSSSVGSLDKTVKDQVGAHSFATYDATSESLLTNLIAKLDKSAALSPDKTAAGPALPEAQPVQVGGQVTVHFDNRMFEDTVVNIMDRRMNSPQTRKTLDNAGYVSAKA